MCKVSWNDSSFDNYCRPQFSLRFYNAPPPPLFYTGCKQFEKSINTFAPVCYNFNGGRGCLEQSNIFGHVAESRRKYAERNSVESLDPLLSTCNENILVEFVLRRTRSFLSIVVDKTVSRAPIEEFLFDLIAHPIDEKDSKILGGDRIKSQPCSEIVFL